MVSDCEAIVSNHRPELVEGFRVQEILRIKKEKGLLGLTSRPFLIHIISGISTLPVEVNIAVP